MVEVVNIPNKQGAVRITKRTRKGPVGLAARLYDIVEDAKIRDRKPNKAAKTIMHEIGNRKPKEVSEAIEILIAELARTEELVEYYNAASKHLPDVFTPVTAAHISVAKALKATKEKAAKEKAVKEEAAKPRASIFEDEEAEEEEVSEKSSGRIRITLINKDDIKKEEEEAKKRKFIPDFIANIDMEKVKERAQDELTYRPGIMKAGLKTKMHMAKFRMKMALGM